MILTGSVVKETPEGVLLFVPADEAERRFIKERTGEPVVEFPDKQAISRAQQKKAHALLRDLAMWAGYMPMEMEKVVTKLAFRDTEPSIIEDEFSLANCSMETARLYITYLIDLCLLYGVPCEEPLYKIAEDIPRYVYACLLNHRCAVCGRKTELHHVDAVGMGRNRKEICHIGMRCLPLCRKHHIEIHTIGRDTFLKKYILEPVCIDARIADSYHLKRR